MKGFLLAALMILLGTTVSGCIAVHSYVDPQYHKASYESIQRLAQPIPVKVDAHFQRNGKPYTNADGELKSHVEQTLRATGVFAPSTTVTTPTISITANNIADLATASAKGFGTGLTLGIAGSTVDDNYEFICTYQDGSHNQKLTYLHAIHSTVGNTTPPAGLTPTTPADAFNHVAEDVILNFVKDLQNAGIATPK